VSVAGAAGDRVEHACLALATDSRVAERTGRLARVKKTDDQSFKVSRTDIAAAEMLATSASRTLYKVSDLRRPKKSDTSGEYDWYRQLAPAERGRIQSRWTVLSPRGVGPDVVADELAPMIGRTVVGMSDVEEVMSEWVQLTRWLTPLDLCATIVSTLPATEDVPSASFLPCQDQVRTTRRREARLTTWRVRSLPTRTIATCDGLQ